MSPATRHRIGAARKRRVYTVCGSRACGDRPALKSSQTIKTNLATMIVPKAHDGEPQMLEAEACDTSHMFQDKASGGNTSSETQTNNGADTGADQEPRPGHCKQRISETWVSSGRRKAPERAMQLMVSREQKGLGPLERRESQLYRRLPTGPHLGWKSPLTEKT